MNKKLKITAFLVLVAFTISAFAPLNSVSTTEKTEAVQTSLTLSVNSALGDLNPAISNSAYDAWAISSVWRGLFTTTTEPGDSSFTQWKKYPYFADTWNKSADELTWFINIKPGLTWHDGKPLNATDFKFGSDSLLKSDFPGSSGTLAIYNGTYWNASTIQAVADHAVSIVNNTALKIQFARWDPFLFEGFVNILPLPSHILGSVPFGTNGAGWRTHTSNTPGGTPLPGNGPYRLVNSTADGTGATLEAWSGFNAAYAAKFTSSTFGMVPAVKSVKIVVNSDPTAALLALKSGQIDLIDSQTNLGTLFNQITAPAKAIKYPSYGLQEMGINHRNPKYGHNPLDPHLLYNATCNINQPPCYNEAMYASQATVTSRANMTEWIMALQAASVADNLDWYFHNLNFTDRVKIRQAFDFSVARQSIIDTLLGGHGFQILTTIFPQTGYVVDDITPRAYSLANARSLLKSVFGYQWAATDNSSTAGIDESIPYFAMTIIAPDNNHARIQWATRIGAALSNVGIDITLKTLPFVSAIDRIFDFPVLANTASVPVAARDNMGVDYKHGGHDVYFAGWGGGPIPGDRFFFHSDSFSPAGGNYQYLNDAYMDSLIQTYEEDHNATARREAYEKFQYFFYWNVTRSMINQGSNIFAMDQALNGFNPFDDYTQHFENLTFAEVVTTTTGPGVTTSGPGATTIVSTVTQASPFGDLYTILGAFAIITTGAIVSRKKQLK